MKTNPPHEPLKGAEPTPVDQSRPVGEPAPTSASLERRLAAWREAFPKLDDMVARELWTNLRMRWTCHSNAIEGNTLTYRGTTLLLLFGRTEGEHLMREYDDIRGHDAAIETVRLWVNERRRPNVDDIRQLHRVLLVAPHWKVSDTDPDDQHSYLVTPGEYKQKPNHVRLPDGNRQFFASPNLVPSLMARFCRDLNTHLDFMFANPDTRDVPTSLAQVHQELVMIHPFTDGNGRLTRLIVNHVAMLLGCPPLIIEDRRTYIHAIRRAVTRDAQPLRDFFARALGQTLDFVLAVADGRADPSWENEHGDPERPPQEPRAHLGDTPPPDFSP